MFRGNTLVTFVRFCFVLTATFPWILPFLRHSLPLGPLGILLDALFLPVCHRIPERTLMFFGIAMPLCSRCAGIFAGLGLGAIMAYPSLSLKHARWSLAIAASLMLLDVVTQDLGLHPLSHTSRLATGALLGYVLSSTLVATIRREQQPYLDRSQTQGKCGRLLTKQ